MIRILEFRWYGTLQGSQRGARRTKRGKWILPKRVKDYLLWKDAVRAEAIQRLGMIFPLQLDPKRRYHIAIEAHWAKRARHDRNNIEKAVEDALVKNDRRILDSTFTTLEDRGEAKEGFRVVLSLREAGDYIVVQD